MSEATCTAACYAMPDCTVCGKRKPPRGRRVPTEATSGYCDPWKCEGYDKEPKPGHKWPGEE